MTQEEHDYKVLSRETGFDGITVVTYYAFLQPDKNELLALYRSKTRTKKV